MHDHVMDFIHKLPKKKLAFAFEPRTNEWIFIDEEHNMIKAKAPYVYLMPEWDGFWEQWYWSHIPGRPIKREWWCPECKSYVVPEVHSLFKTKICGLCKSTVVREKNENK